MPISRSVYKRKDGTRVITLPKSWVEILEDKYGEKLEEVHMDISNEKIIITPNIGGKDEQHEPQED